MSRYKYSEVDICGELRSFSNVNDANVAVREWIDGADFNKDVEFTLTYWTQPTTEEQLDRNVRHFKNVLRRQCLSRDKQRLAMKDSKSDLKMFGTLEGVVGNNAHYHVIMQIPDAMTFDELQRAVKYSWSRVYGSGRQFEFDHYKDKGRIQYNCKEIDRFYSDPICTQLSNF